MMKNKNSHKFYHIFLFFLLLLFLILAGASNSGCPSSFECEKLGTLEFPLSDRQGCGLFLLQNCRPYEDPIIQFEAEGSWYTILRNISTNKFLILDPFLHEHKRNNFCLGLTRNLPLSSSFVSFQVSHNLTLFKCPSRRPSDNAEPTQYDYFKDYNRTTCSPFDMYYTNPARRAADQDQIPSTCSVFQVPINSTENFSGELWDMLSPEYVIEWNVSDDCYRCHHDGGKCITTDLNRFFCDKGGDKRLVVLMASTGVGTLAALTVFFVATVFILIRRRHILSRLQKAKTKQELDIELFLKNYGNIMPKRYNYSDLKKMTKSFLESLGKGGYGSVYKGVLPNGHPVAVKILNESKGSGEEFVNEVASICRTSHINVVTLVGFCYEGSKRALIYDFMTNGSLEKYLQNTSECVLGWEKLFEISLGIARGLDYLHQGCNTRILHFDIKPHNILLDKDFNPKISDFGLAKLCPNRSSTVSMLMARGTIGYIAPEVFCRNFGEVSYKSDVYSYGMMVLEIAGEKRGIDRGDVDHTSETYFPQYIYKELERMDIERHGELDGITTNEDESAGLSKRKLIIVGLWCVQTDPKDRPSMSKVVEMLEGKLESLQVPPKPYMSSPPRLALDFSIASSSV